MSASDFFQDLKQRKFFKEISIYAVTAWIVIQVAVVIFPHVGIPNYGITIVILLCLLGLPVWMVISWRHNIFDKDSEEENSDLESTPEKVMRGKIFFRMLSGVSLVVLILCGFIVKNNFFPDTGPLVTYDDKVEVSIFENNTGEANLNMVGKMISDWITQGLKETNAVKVVDYSTINRQSQASTTPIIGAGVANTRPSLNKATKIIRGSYYKVKDSLLIRGNVINGVTGEIEYAFQDVTCHQDDAVQGANDLKNIVLGYWAIQSDNFLESAPPKYEAYKEFLHALDFWEQDYNQSLVHLDNAIDMDQNFRQAYFWKITLLYNTNKYEQAKQLIDYFETTQDNLSQSEQNYVRYWKNRINRNNLSAFQSYKPIFNVDEKDITNNTNYALLALECVNKPELSLEIMSKINEDSVDYDAQYYYINRKLIQGRSLMQLGRNEEAFELLDNVESYNNERMLRALKLRAAIRSDKLEEVDRILQLSKSENLDRDFRYLFYTAGREFELINDESNRDKYAKQAIDLYQSSPNSSDRMKARSYYLMGDWDRALMYFDKTLETQPEHIFTLAQKAIIYAKMGDEQRARVLVRTIEKLENENNNRIVSYELGRIHAVLGDINIAVKKLSDALLKGQLYSWVNFNYEPDIKNYLPANRMEEIMEFFKV